MSTQKKAVLLILLIVFMPYIGLFSSVPVIKAAPDTETLYVDGYTEVTRQWTEVGSSPWLNNSTANEIYTKTDEYWHEEFTFANSGVGSGTINSVYLYVEMKGDAGRNDYADYFVHDGATWTSVLQQDDDTGTYTWYNVDISTVIDTWAKIDSAKLKVQYQRVGSPSTVEIYVRRAYLYIDYTAGGASYTRQANQTLIVSEEAIRDWTSVNNIFQTLSINNIASKVGSFFRTGIQSLSLGDLTSIILTNVRQVFQSISLGAVSTRLLTALRSSLQSITLSDIATRIYTPAEGNNPSIVSIAVSPLMRRTLTLVRGISMPFLINSAVTRLLSVFRNIFQGLTISNVAEAVYIPYMTVRDIFQTLTLSASTIKKSITTIVQELTISNIAESLYIPYMTIRDVFQQLTLSELATRLYTGIRPVTQQLSLSTSTLSGLVFSRFPFQTLTLSDATSRIHIGIRTVFQTVSVSEFSSRISYVFRTAFQNLTINNIATAVSAELFIRDVFQTLSLSEVATRIRTVIRGVAQTLTVGNLEIRWISVSVLVRESLTTATRTIAPVEAVIVVVDTSTYGLAFVALAIALCALVFAVKRREGKPIIYVAK